MHVSLARLCLRAAVLFTLVTSACSSTSPSQTAEAQQLVAAIEGTDALIGMVLGPDQAVVYVCDGTETGATVAEWMHGPASSDGFDLSAPGVRVRATKAGAGVSGTVTFADGSEHAFPAARAIASGGVYRDSSSYQDILGGWIVLDDGSMRGAVKIAGGTFASSGKTTSGGTLSATSGALLLTGVRVVSSSAPTPPTASAGSSCSASTTCSGHGACNATGGCTCAQGFTGPSCNTCATGFFGYPTCKFCSSATTCGGRGTCDGAGSCLCSAGFTGATCNACASNHFGFPACKFCSAATTCSGRGTCDAAGNCICSAGFTGPSCQ